MRQVGKLMADDDRRDGYVVLEASFAQEESTEQRVKLMTCWIEWLTARVDLEIRREIEKTQRSMAL